MAATPSYATDASVTKSMHDVLSPAMALEANEYTAAATGDEVDLQGFESCEIVVVAGTIGGTSTPTFPIVVQESNTSGSGYSNVAAADLDGGTFDDFVAANDAGEQRRGYIGKKRYIRVNVGTVTGTTPTLDLAAVAVRGHPRSAPTA